MIFKTSSMLRLFLYRSMEEVFQPAHTGSSRVCVSRKVRDFTNGWGASSTLYKIIKFSISYNNKFPPSPGFNLLSI